VLLDRTLTAARTQWGRALHNSKFPEGDAQFEEAVKINPANADVYVNWGGALVAVEQYPQALEKYRTAIEKNPADVWARTGWGEALYKWGKPEEAAAQFGEALKINPAYVEVYRIWGDNLAAFGTTDAAIAKFKKALEIDPFSIGARAGLSEAQKAAADKLASPDSGPAKTSRITLKKERPRSWSIAAEGRPQRFAQPRDLAGF
jgi:tetratricopeptide (TPR) repeat protein